jgi:stringent starvation protein B
MAEVSTKPYFIRAVYEWCSDCGYTPYLSVRVDERTRVPTEFVKDGEIVLNVSQSATRDLTINNDLVQFSARFGGVSREVSVPIDRVLGIFARESGHGAFFAIEEGGSDPAAGGGPSEVALNGHPEPPPTPSPGRGRLKLVK